MSAFTVIGAKNFGKHGKARKWFGTHEEAALYADELLRLCQVGRSTRNVTDTKAVKLYIVEAVGVVELRNTPVQRRKVKRGDIATMFYRAGISQE